jgi:hypothetical protein
MTKVIIFPEPGQEGRDKFLAKLPNGWERGNHQLLKELTDNGFEVDVWPCEVDKQKDVGLCFDFPRYPCDIPDRAMCVMLEPPVVHPRQYDKINGLPFKRILSFARDFCDYKRVFWEPYPITQYEGPPLVAADKYMCAVSGGGKDFASVSIHGRGYESLYQSRRHAYLAMGRDLDLYGFGWENDVEMRNSVNYRGPIPGHKVDIMSQYRFAIVFENCPCKGYASEKQYDAHAAGVTPILRGWKPDYPWEYAFTENWVKRVVKHLTAIV